MAEINTTTCVGATQVGATCVIPAPMVAPTPPPTPNPAFVLEFFLGGAWVESSGTLDFGTTEDADVVVQVRLRNTGNVLLVIDVTLSGDRFSTDAPSEVSLDVGETYPFSITFSHADSAGVYPGEISCVSGEIVHSSEFFVTETVPVVAQMIFDPTPLAAEFADVQEYLVLSVVAVLYDEENGWHTELIKQNPIEEGVFDVVDFRDELLSIVPSGSVKVAFVLSHNSLTDFLIIPQVDSGSVGLFNIDELGYVEAGGWVNVVHYLCGIDIDDVQTASFQVSAKSYFVEPGNFAERWVDSYKMLADGTSDGDQLSFVGNANSVGDEPAVFKTSERPEGPCISFMSGNCRYGSGLGIHSFTDFFCVSAIPSETFTANGAIYGSENIFALMGLVGKTTFEPYGYGDTYFFNGEENPTRDAHLNEPAGVHHLRMSGEASGYPHPGLALFDLLTDLNVQPCYVFETFGFNKMNLYGYADADLVYDYFIVGLTNYLKLKWKVIDL